MEEALVVVKKCFNLFYCSELFFISSCDVEIIHIFRVLVFT